MVGYLSSTGQRNVADEDDKNQELKETLHDQCGPKKKYVFTKNWFILDSSLLQKNCADV